MTDEALDPRSALSEVAALRRDIRSHLHPVSTPLLAVGGAMAALFALLGDGRELGPGFLGWLLAIPLLFAGLAWWERRRAVRSGAGGPGGAYTATAITTLVLVLVGVPLLLSPVRS